MTKHALYVHKAKMCEEVRSGHQEEIRMHESQSRSVLIQSHYQTNYATCSTPIHIYTPLHAALWKCSILHLYWTPARLELQYCMEFCNDYAHFRVLHWSAFVALHYNALQCTVRCLVSIVERRIIATILSCWLRTLITSLSSERWTFIPSTTSSTSSSSSSFFCFSCFCFFSSSV